VITASQYRNTLQTADRNSKNDGANHAQSPYRSTKNGDRNCQSDGSKAEVHTKILTKSDLSATDQTKTAGMKREMLNKPTTDLNLETHTRVSTENGRY